MKLDLKDKKILRELSYNARQPISKLAKKIKLSKEVTNYRVKRLFENNIIAKTFAIIDFGKLGITTYRIYLKLANVTPEKEKEIIKNLKDLEQTQWLGFGDGCWTVVMRVSARTLTEFDQIHTNILQKYGEFIAEKEITLTTHHSFQPQSYFLTKDKPKLPPLYPLELDKQEILDKKDIEIVNILHNDARTHIADIAKRIKLSSNATAERIKQLEKKQIIRRYAAVIPLNNLEYQLFQVFFQFHFTNPIKIKAFIDYWISHPNIVGVIKVIGAWDIEIGIAAKTNLQLHEIMRDCLKQFSDVVKEHQTFLVFKMWMMNPFKNKKY